MPRSGLAMSRGETAERATRPVRARFDGVAEESEFDRRAEVGLDSYRFEADRLRRRMEQRGGELTELPPSAPPRRTVAITGHGAEGYASRNGTRPSSAERYRGLKRHERDGFRPDRVAMWAFLLGLIMVLAAAASSHAAVLVTHHALSLH